MEIENKTFHIIPYGKLSGSDKYLQQYNCVQLNISGDKEIKFTIQEVEEELKQIEKQKGKKPEVIIKQKNKLIDSFKELQWIASVSYQINDTPADFSKSTGIADGIDKDFRSCTFPKMLIGGGFVYVAAQFPEKSPYKNAKFKGLYYQALGKPAVVRMEWTDLNDNVLPDNKLIKYGSHVILNIYTEGLYGQEVEVYLYDYDYLDPNDLLKIKNKNFFVREVKYEELKRTSSKDATGTLLNSKGVAEEYNQMLSFKIFIDHTWRTAAKGDGVIEIFPVIRPVNMPEFLEIPNLKKLRVSDSRNADLMSHQVNASNNPAVVNEIVTNIAPYHPCGYSSININEEKRSPYTVFKQDVDTVVKNPYEIIAGQQQKVVKTILIELDDKASTSECNIKQFSPNSESHSGHVFNIIKYPEKGVSENSKKEETSDWSIKTESGKKSSGLGEKSSTKYELGGNDKLKILEKGDKHIKFEARYVYNKLPILIGHFTINYLYRYVWVGNMNATQQYSVEVNSCRYGKQLVNIDVYPNLAWAIRLEYTGDGEIKSSRQLLSDQTYQNSRTATYNRQPTQWIKAGERNLGIKLEAKVINDEDKDEDNDSVDISGEIIEVIKEKIQPIVKLYDMLKGTVNGEGANENTELSNYEQRRLTESRQRVREFAESQNNPDAQAAALARRKAKEKADLKKIKNAFDENARVLKEHGKNKDSKEYKDALKRQKSLQRKKDKFNPDLIRKPINLELTFPDFGLEFEWKRVPITSPAHPELQNKTGIELTGKFEAVPIIGAKVYFDFFGLAQRLHPIALAVVAALDIGMKLIGNGSRIIAEFSIGAEIEGSFEGFYNMATGENSFNSNDRKNNDKHLVELGGKMAFEVLVAIHLQLEKRVVNIFTGTKYEGTLEGGAEVKANADFTGKTKFYSDDSGFYGVPSGKFEGLSFSGSIELKGEFGEQEKKPIFSDERKVEFTYEGIPASEEITLEKFYIIKSEK